MPMQLLPVTVPRWAMTGPDLNLLTSLDILLEEASVTRAAQRLGLSTSAMSRTLGRLRETTGDLLLVRAGRELVLTPHAEQLRESCRQVMLDARRMLAPAMPALDLESLQRRFVIRANDGFVSALAPGLITTIGRQAAGVTLQFMAKPRKSVGHLRDGQTDLDIGVLTVMGPEIKIQALFRDRFVAVIREGHPMAIHGELSLEDYLSCGHVVASRHDQGRGPVDQALAEIGRQRRISTIVPGFPAVLDVVLDSDLIGLVPASLLTARNAFHALGLRRFALPASTPDITISQMWHPRMDADPAHRWLRQTVKAYCRQQLGDLA